MATKRQKKLASVIKKNLRKPGKKPSLGKMAKEADYSDRMAEHPKEIIETKGMKELLIDLMPEGEAAKIHAGLMKMETLDNFPFDIALEDEKIKEVVSALGCRLLTIAVVAIIGKKVAYFAVPNGRIRKDGLELYYKVTGNFAPDRLKISPDDIDEVPEGELDDRIKETDELAKRFRKYAAPLIKKKRQAKKKK